MDNSWEKWWGWGDLKKRYDLSRKPFFWPHLRRKLNFPDKPFLSPPDFGDIQFPPSRLSGSDLRELERILSKEQVATSKEERVSHTYGKSYHDLVRIRRGIFPDAPDAVLYPVTEEDVGKILTWATESRVAVIPRGGGTSVTGGVEAVQGSGHRGLLVIDLRRMDKVLGIHKTSLVADVQAGILGPKLERELQAQGVTLSHFLESFEFSTLGGWIAARSAGQQSTLYGKIEDMVESVRLLAPTGLFRTLHLPAAANGPDLTRIVVGSEGTLGIITQARLRLRPIPERRIYTAVLFHSFEEGVESVRQIMQSGTVPATLRLSDPEETEVIFSLREKRGSSIANLLHNVGVGWLEKRGFVPEKRSMLIWGLEGTAQRTKADYRAIQRILKSFSPFDLGHRIGADWYRHRFDNPYLRDVLMDYDLLVDTLETATEWDNVWNLYVAVRNAVRQAYDQLGIKGIVTAHLSHMYLTGTSLYFILLATPHVGHERDEWWAIKRAASDTIVAREATISHHHGIGLDHRAWLVHDVGEAGIRLLRRLKQELDPAGILNPGKLLPDSEDA